MRVILFRDHPAEGWPSMDRYAESLFEALRSVAPVGWEVAMPMLPAPRLPGPHGQLLNRLFVYPFAARLHRANMYHLLDHSYGHLLWSVDRQRTVATVHDVAPLRFASRSLGLSSVSWAFAWAGVRRARALITDSTFTAQEVRSLLGQSTPSVCVVHNGVSSLFHALPGTASASFRAKYVSSDQRLLLHVGSCHPRKNLPALLRALRLLRNNGIPAVLLQAGGVAPSQVMAQVDSLDLSQAVQFIGKVTDEELIALYNAADLFVFPSLYEGFGLPVLEAMACGAPVVAAAAASLPEVVGDAGLLADPHSPEEIASACADILRSRDLAEELRRRGLERAREFTWERAARQILDIYRHALAEKKGLEAASL